MSTSEPLRLLFISTGLGTGGAEMMLSQLVTRLDSRRFLPAVVSLTDGGKHAEILKASGIQVHSLGMPAGRPTVAALWRLWRITRQCRPDVLVGWMYHGNLAALMARFFCLRRVPVIWNVRQSLYSIDLEKRRSAAVIRLLAPLSRFVTRIAYNSQVSAHQHESLGYARRKTALVPNGFDVSRFKPDAEARRSVRDELQLNSDALLIGRFGRWAAMKDYATFIEAAGILHRQRDDVHFLLAGTGVDAANAELRNLVCHSGAASRIHVLGERDDLPRLTAALDVACSSSAFGEGFPNVVGEAMAGGVPVVATGVGDTAWLLDDAGVHVEPRQPQALADALSQMLDRPASERAALGRVGRERICREFSIDAVLSRYEDLFLGGPAPEILKPLQPAASTCAG